MVGDAKDDVGEAVTPTDTGIKKKKKKRGFLSRLWGALFRVHGDDFEKRLEHISKEESAVLTRIAKRSHSGRRLARNIIIFFILSEVIAIGYAYMSTRSSDLYWKIRALHVLPMFLLPVLGVITYSVLKSYTRMRDQKDRNTLEKLRAERQAKIDELKERTNYYTTQQLIQRYDPDPAAKAAAATVLASKLGADCGLKVYVGDDSNANVPTGRSNDVQVAVSGGLRNRKQSLAKTSSAESGLTHKPEEGMHSEFEGAAADDVPYEQRRLVVEHHPQSGVSSNDGGWIARFAALLVGEDPTQSYALICGSCHMHNGLVRKEDFPYITYYCPHCKALNIPKQSGDPVSSSSSCSRSPTVASVAANAEDTQAVPPSSSLAGPGSIIVGDNVSSIPPGSMTSDKSLQGGTAASGIPES